MNLVDANVLLYAVDSSARVHKASRTWLEESLSGTASVLLPWLSLIAFLRLSTHPRIFERPLEWEEAAQRVDEWLASPFAWVPEPDNRHLDRMRGLLDGAGRGGNIINDAHLAALALQHNATVVTFDTDFARFPGIKTLTPGR